MDYDDKTNRILDYIHEFFDKNQRTPTIREIMQGAKISSTSLVSYHLRTLTEHGEISIDPIVSRGIRILKPRMWTGMNSRAVPIPYLGVIAAGSPIPMPDPDTGPFAADAAYTVVDREELPQGVMNSIYALHVHGNSMTDALIRDGDTVVIKYQSTAEPGDCVVANIKDEGTTLKHYYPQGNQIELRPANPNFQSINRKPSDVEILGKVLMVKRRF